MSNTPDATPANAQDEWDNIDEGEGSPAEPASADHPANPATYPIPPKPKLSEVKRLNPEELAEKGRLLAKKLVEIEEKKEERTELNGELKELEEEALKLRNIVLAGTVEVPVGQEDLFRQGLGGKAVAEAFDEMAREAAEAGQGELSQAAQEAAEAQQGLNAMAEGIQAENGVPAPGPGFQNDIENFKAKAAAKRKKGNR